MEFSILQLNLFKCSLNNSNCFPGGQPPGFLVHGNAGGGVADLQKKLVGVLDDANLYNCEYRCQFISVYYCNDDLCYTVRITVQQRSFVISKLGLRIASQRCENSRFCKLLRFIFHRFQKLGGCNIKCVSYR
jgi:hypothetical protein